jgi:hypothetical protein
MSDELDDFLRQAAMRRQQRQQEKAKKENTIPAPKPTPSPLRPAPTKAALPNSAARPPAPLQRPSVPVAEVVELRPTLSDFESTIANRHVQSDLSQADERMAEHVKSAMGSDLASPRPQWNDSRKNKQSSGRDSNEKFSATAPEGAIQSQAKVSSQDIKSQLRDPQTMRMAIIAHEILRRPYQ